MTDKLGRISTAILILFILLVVFSSLLTFFTTSAYRVVAHADIIGHNGRPHWRTSGWSLFPWPKEPTGPVFMVLVPLSPIEVTIYRLIKTGKLQVIAFALWIGTFILGLIFLRLFLRETSAHH